MLAEFLPKATIGGNDNTGARSFTNFFFIKFAASILLTPVFSSAVIYRSTNSLIRWAFMILASSFLLFTARTSWISFILTIVFFVYFRLRRTSAPACLRQELENISYVVISHGNHKQDKE